MARSVSLERNSQGGISITDGMSEKFEPEVNGASVDVTVIKFPGETSGSIGDAGVFEDDREWSGCSTDIIDDGVV
jgi:hypothetical protein